MSYGRDKIIIAVAFSESYRKKTHLPYSNELLDFYFYFKGEYLPTICRITSIILDIRLGTYNGYSVRNLLYNILMVCKCNFTKM